MHFLSPGDWLSRLTPERDWKSKFFVVCGLFCHCCCAVLNGSFITICIRWIKLLFGKWKVYTAGFDQGVCQGTVARHCRNKHVNSGLCHQALAKPDFTPLCSPVGIFIYPSIHLHQQTLLHPFMLPLWYLIAGVTEVQAL